MLLQVYFVLNILAAVLVIASVLMKGITKLRVMAIMADSCELTASVITLSPISIVKYCITLPVSWVRLREMRRLIKRSELAATGDLSMTWLQQFMEPRKAKAGQIIFRRGDVADRMFMVASGRFRLIESGLEIKTAQIVGEFGLLTPGNRRTQGFLCVEAGDLYEISYEYVRELYFQNPEFGFYFLTLTSRRLLENVASLEAELAKRPRRAPWRSSPKTRRAFPPRTWRTRPAT